VRRAGDAVVNMLEEVREKYAYPRDRCRDPAATKKARGAWRIKSCHH